MSPGRHAGQEIPASATPSQSAAYGLPLSNRYRYRFVIFTEAGVREMADHTLAAVALAVGVALLIAGTMALIPRTSNAAVEAEAAALAAEPFEREPGREVVVITGSSTVRFWRSTQEAFPDAQVVNNGFGGSTMAQLRRHSEGLVTRFEPDRVYIGSGDNDLAQGRSVAAILADTEALLASLRRANPAVEVALIAAKPSLSRWHLHRDYRELNAGFAQLALADDSTAFVDVWNELLDPRGGVRPELYASDGLHLNANGYRIYTATLAASGPAL